MKKGYRILDIEAKIWIKSTIFCKLSYHYMTRISHTSLYVTDAYGPSPLVLQMHKNRKHIKITDIHLRFAIVIRKHQMVHVEKDIPPPQTSVNQHYYKSTPYRNCGQVKVLCTYKSIHPRKHINICPFLCWHVRGKLSK